MRSAIAILCICLTGCSSGTPTPEPQWNDVVVLITLTDDLPEDMMGDAIVYNGVCKVRLRRSTYPKCLPHEMLHCFGWSHSDKPNNKFCEVPSD